MYHQIQRVRSQRIEQDVNTSSGSFPYCFSKSAIGQATASLAHELIPLGIRVNGIAPGYFPTMVVLAVAFIITH